MYLKQKGYGDCELSRARMEQEYTGAELGWSRNILEQGYGGAELGWSTDGMEQS